VESRNPCASLPTKKSIQSISRLLSPTKAFVHRHPMAAARTSQLSLPVSGTSALAHLHSTHPATLPTAGQNLGRIFNASPVQQHTSELCFDIARPLCNHLHSLDCITTPTPPYTESTYTYRRLSECSGADTAMLNRCLHIKFHNASYRVENTGLAHAR
jgi:hypothetical protein